ncbi:MAG: hypothetical protein AB7P40_00465 [Chloroflexota bacterium]
MAPRRAPAVMFGDSVQVIHRPHTRGIDAVVTAARDHDQSEIV